MRKRGEGGGRSRKKDWGWDEEGKRGKDERETNEEEGRRRRKKPEEGGRIWKKRDEGGMFSESVGTRRTHSKRCMLRLAVISRWPATW